MPPTKLTSHTATIRRLAAAHGVQRLRVFGSHARGDATRASDLDLLVELGPERDLLDLAGFKLDVEELLGCRVDASLHQQAEVGYGSVKRSFVT